jgi:hypothetical protein
MTDRVLGGTHPSEPDHRAQGEETPDAKPRADAAPASAGPSTDDTVPSHGAPAGAEPGTPESLAAGGPEESTRVMSSSDRLAALVARTRIRTGKYPAVETGTGSDSVGFAPGSANAPMRAGQVELDSAPQTLGETEPTEKNQRPGQGATSASPNVPTRAGQLGPTPAPQTIDEAEPTEKSQAPGGGAEVAPFGEAVNLYEGPADHAPGTTRRRGLPWKIGIVVVACALGWFVVAQVLPRYRIAGGNAPEAVDHPAQPNVPIKEAPPPVPSPPTPAAPSAIAPPGPAPSTEPIAPPAARTAESPDPDGPPSRVKAAGAASPRPASRSHPRARAKAAVRPARSATDDPDAILPPRSPSTKRP